MTENKLIKYCSPTLAGLKTANLYTERFDNTAQLNDYIYIWNKRLNCKGVSLDALRVKNNSALIYVCRKQRLNADLQKQGVCEFLREFGYDSALTAEKTIQNLKRRLMCNKNFPHEIGLFLGYPLCDVKAFIENKGKNSKFNGVWKVYSDVQQARRTFEGFKKCRNIYAEQYKTGKSVVQLTANSSGVK
ncbi:MAG: DUF3793 family protein [Acutalibacteraceae bacterium]